MLTTDQRYVTITLLKENYHKNKLLKQQRYTQRNSQEQKLILLLSGFNMRRLRSYIVQCHRH